MPTLYPKKALMYDTENFRPTDGQMFQWDSESGSVIPVSNDIGGIITQEGSGSGIGDVLVASIAITNYSTTSITGTVNVTCNINSGGDYLVGDTAAWNFTAGPILVNFQSGASFTLQPAAYDESAPTAYPEMQITTGAADFKEASLFVICAANILYLYYRPDSNWYGRGDGWITKCSLNVVTQTFPAPL